VRSLIGEARAAGISGVPFFIVDEVHGLSGAQSPETLLAVLDEAAGARAGADDRTETRT
jgi:predicted DsbA family dithiol-disulfide isomerase